MNNRNLKTSSLTEAAMMSAILVIIAFISQFLFPFLMIFYSLPAVILAKRKGLKYSAMSLVSAGLIISMLLGIQTGIIYLILYSPLAIVLSYGIAKDEEPYKTILYGAITYIVSFAVIMIFMQYVMGINYIKQIMDLFNESFEMSKEMILNSSKNIEPAKTQEMIDNVNLTLNLYNFLLSQLFPAFLIGTGVMISFINYVATCKFAKRFKIDIKKPHGFQHFTLPYSFAIAMAALLLTTYLLKYLNLNVQTIQFNILAICAMAAFVQGIALLKFYLINWNISKAFRTFIVIMILFNIVFLQLLAFAGLIDLILDLRKLRNKLV